MQSFLVTVSKRWSRGLLPVKMTDKLLWITFQCLVTHLQPYCSIPFTDLPELTDVQLTQWWFLDLRYRPAPCVGWCCCVLLLTSSCETPMGCWTLWLETGLLLEAKRAPRSPPAMLAFSDLFEASGLSGCEEQKEKMKKKSWTCKCISSHWSGFYRWFSVGNPRLVLGYSTHRSEKKPYNSGH